MALQLRHSLESNKLWDDITTCSGILPSMMNCLSLQRSQLLVSY